MTILAYKKIIAKLIKAYHKKYDAFGNKKRKGKKRAKR
jgi:hypothetical protein